MSNPELTIVFGQNYEQVLNKAKWLAKGKKGLVFDMAQSTILADYVFDVGTSQHQVYRLALRINAISNSVLAGQSIIVPFGDYDDCLSAFKMELIKRVSVVDCVVECIEA